MVSVSFFLCRCTFIWIKGILGSSISVIVFVIKLGVAINSRGPFLKIVLIGKTYEKNGKIYGITIFGYFFFFLLLFNTTNTFEF